MSVDIYYLKMYNFRSAFICTALTGVSQAAVWTQARMSKYSENPFVS